MRTLIIYLIFSILLFRCTTESEETLPKDYTLIYDQGIYFEKFDSTNIFTDRFSTNNQSYIVGTKLTYNYYYQDLNGDKFKFQETKIPEGSIDDKNTELWNFISLDSLETSAINHVVLKILGTTNWYQEHMPDYNQTVIAYQFPQLDGTINIHSTTGVIDNEKNVWVHPPRIRFFKILEINPFPFIQAPYEVGNQWEWSLKIGSFWGDKRWATWEESIENKYKYEIVGKQKMRTPIGSLECYVIEASASSRIGQTHLRSYFNSNIGFVKLEYTNIDATKTVLELIKVE